MLVNIVTYSEFLYSKKNSSSEVVFFARVYEYVVVEGC